MRTKAVFVNQRDQVSNIHNKEYRTHGRSLVGHHKWAEQMTWGHHAERIVNARGGMYGTTPELSRLIHSSFVTADPRVHDRQCQKQRTNLTTPMQRHLQSWQPADQTERDEQQFLSNGRPTARLERRQKLSCCATIRSSNFDATKRLEIGRYDWAFVTSRQAS